MMQFYKKRDFGTLISDTFQFFKIYGKNYFRSFLLLNGILLIAMVAVFIFGYRELLMQIFGSNLSGESYYFEKYFQENAAMLIVVIGIVAVLFLLLMILVYLFPIFYLKRVSAGQQKVSNDDILSDIKANLGKIAIFAVCSIFIIYPLAILVFGITYLLMIIIIGFFLMILIMPAMMNAIFFLMYDYFNTDKGFFQSLSYGIRAQFSYPHGRERSPFWKYWGSTVIIYFIINIVVGIFSMVPAFIIFSRALTVPEHGEISENPFEGATGIIIFVIYGISFLVSFILNNILTVNAGLMYYDSRVDLHQKENLSEIESIGVHEE